MTVPGVMPFETDEALFIYFHVGPVWLKNLYFTYTLVLRAITKAAKYWEFEQFYTGDYEEDEHVQELVQTLIAHSR
jgi:ERO1-like protein alpha/ERO1-like protein beta